MQSVCGPSPRALSADIKAQDLSQLKCSFNKDHETMHTYHICPLNIKLEPGDVGVAQRLEVAGFTGGLCAGLTWSLVR